MAKRKTIEKHHVAGRRVCIGADPSISNFALVVWDVEAQKFAAMATYDWDKARKIGLMIHAEARMSKFYVEDSSQHGFVYRRVLKKWHKNMSKQQFSKWLAQVNSQAMSIGENHGATKLIIDTWKTAGLSINPVTPVRRKKNAAAFQALTGYTGSTNQNERDAGLFVFGR